MFGAILYFPMQLMNIKMEILSLIASKLTTVDVDLPSMESDSITVESTNAEIQNEEAISNEIFPNAIIVLRPLTVCTTST